MSGEAVSVAPWLVVFLTLLLAAIATAVLRTRSVFVMHVGFASAASVAAAILLAAGAGDGALVLAAFGVGIAPVWLLGSMLLSTRAAKPAPRSLGLLVLLGVLVGAAGAGLIAPEFAFADRPAASSAPPTFWLVVGVFSAAIGAAGLLGYGERGAFERRDRERL